MRFSSIALSLLPAVFAAEAADAADALVNRPTPPTPGWKFLYNCNITMGYFIEVGNNAANNFTRAVLPIQGGQFEGVNGLTGRVLAVGAEWSSFSGTTGYFISDARYQLQTEDRAAIYVNAQGNSQSSGLTHVRAKFETGVPKYAWMNDILAVGIMQTTKLGYMIDMWQVISPNYTYF